MSGCPGGFDVTVEEAGACSILAQGLLSGVSAELRRKAARSCQVRSVGRPSGFERKSGSATEIGRVISELARPAGARHPWVWGRLLPGSAQGASEMYGAAAARLEEGLREGQLGCRRPACAGWPGTRDRAGGARLSTGG